MEEEYYVKISGANVVYTKVDTIKSMMRRIRRLKMELEEIKKERSEKRKHLLELLGEATETMKLIEKYMPAKGRKVKKREELEVKKQKGKVTKKTVKKKKVSIKPQVSKKTVSELSDLRSELEKLKKELED